MNKRKFGKIVLRVSKGIYEGYDENGVRVIFAMSRAEFLRKAKEYQRGGIKAVSKYLNFSEQQAAKALPPVITRYRFGWDGYIQTIRSRDERYGYFPTLDEALNARIKDMEERVKTAKGELKLLKRIRTRAREIAKKRRAK